MLWKTKNGVKRKAFLSFDPRTKILLLIELDILIFLGRSLVYESVLFFFCLLLIALSGKWQSSVGWGLAFSLFLLVQKGVEPYLYRWGGSLIYFLVVVVRKVLPVFLLGKWLINTTKVSEFIAAMQKWKVPQSAIITTSVIFRCLPTLKEEWAAITSAMKLRGIALSPVNIVRQPSQTIVYIFVPLFISALNIADELSAAALCRGIDNPGKHTNIEEVRFRSFDLFFIILTSVVLAAVIVARWKGVAL